MEEIGVTNPKYRPLGVLWRPFVHPRSKNHPFGAQIVPLMCEELFT